MAIPVYKKYHYSKPNNIAYIKGDIIDVIVSKINTKSGSSQNLLIPECFSLEPKDDTRLSSRIQQIFPQIKINLDMYRSSGSKNYGTVQFLEVFNIHNKNLGKIIFANMICKKNQKYSRPLDYIALAKTMEMISSYIISHNKNNEETVDIVGSKFGTGKSGGEWSFIEKMIEDAWSDLSVQIYYGQS